MKCVVCTLFEHHYHFGLAVFVNSLCKSGYAGTVYAGFRGPLPPWAQNSAKLLPNGHSEFQVSPEVRLVFIPLTTSAHLTNYKPDFMLQVEALASAGSDALIYCDPDIVINIKWPYIEDWISCGVAVCEDVNSPVSENHPTRIGWRRFFKSHGYALQFRTTSYANGGFVGLTWNYRKLLPLWQKYLALIAELLGGSNVAGIGGGKMLPGFYGFADCFSRTDQDALNAILEASPEIPVSFLGQEAMGFRAGRSLLPHALGYPKPWNRDYLRKALSGIPPAKVDKIYWKNVQGPIQPFTPAHIFYIRSQLALCAALGRFIRRSY
jgi:hypothetical protein